MAGDVAQPFRLRVKLPPPLKLRRTAVALAGSPARQPRWGALGGGG
jgi:hypothetical protein